MDIRGFHVRSLMLKNSYVFSWSVKNCAAWPSGTNLESPTFFLETGLPFYATIRVSQDFYLTLFRNPACVKESLRVDHNMFVTDSAGKVFTNVSKSCTYTKDSPFFQFKYTASEISEFNNAAEEHVLEFRCAMAFEELKTELDHTKRYAVPLSPSLNNLTALTADFQSMFASSHLADVSLTSGDIVLRAHKFVLCARSPVFAKMFATPMEESEKNVVDITDLELPVLKDLVEFLYTGQLPNDDFESAYSLYPAADKYDVSSLRKTCRDVLLSKLDVRNACRALVLADLHSDVGLKDAAMEFISFHFDQILKTEMWNEFVADKSKLAIEVLLVQLKFKRGTEIKSN